MLNIILQLNKEKEPLLETDMPLRGDGTERLSGEGLIYFNKVCKGKYDFGCKGEFKNLTQEVSKGIPLINDIDVNFLFQKLRKRNGNGGFFNNAKKSLKETIPLKYMI